MRVRFGHCIFDDESRELLRGEHRVPLTAKAFELLDLLISERPRALRKSQIFDRLWPETFVSESNLAALVHEIRQAVGDTANRPRFVRTVRGFGYAFCGKTVDLTEGRAHESHGRVHHRLVCGIVEVALAEGENIIGRSPDAVMLIDSPMVSRRHARILVRNETAVLEDLGSRHGTYLNDDAVHAPVLLSDGDQIRTGSVRMTFRVV